MQKSREAAADVRVGHIGLGDMGGAIAGRIADGGYELRVLDLRPDAVAQLVDKGAIEADDVADLARNSDVVIICVGHDAEVLALYPEVLANMSAGSTLIVHSSVHPELVEKIGAEAEARGVAVLDGPVAGGRVGAESGTLSVFIGGREEDLLAVGDVVSQYSSSFIRIGPLGAGQSMKMINNYLATAQVELASQAARIFDNLGMDRRAAFTALANSTGGAEIHRWLINDWVEHSNGTLNVFIGVHHKNGPLRSVVMMGEVVDHARDLLMRADAIEPLLDELVDRGIHLCRREAIAAAEGPST
jgi:3-hydroxyisobutyrate dehydrogenase